MTHHLKLVGAVLVACALVLILWPTWPRIRSAAATWSAAHVGVAAAIHVGVILVGAVVLVAARRSRAKAGRDHAAPGATIRWARLYDWLAAAHALGREGRMRERMLDVAGVGVGDHVLDVCCGTGTLALAAKRRVGTNGSVHGIDAASPMIARARAKAARGGAPVTFDVATAQSLPFADASFDAVLCTLALHHLPEDVRAGAVAEMRRVLKPGGRVLIVEFSRQVGWAALNPVTLLHVLRSPRMLDEAAALMKEADFRKFASGPLGFGGMGYVLARLD